MPQPSSTPAISISAASQERCKFRQPLELVPVAAWRPDPGCSACTASPASSPRRISVWRPDPGGRGLPKPPGRPAVPPSSILEAVVAGFGCPPGPALSTPRPRRPRHQAPPRPAPSMQSRLPRHPRLPNARAVQHLSDVRAAKFLPNTLGLQLPTSPTPAPSKLLPDACGIQVPAAPAPSSPPTQGLQKHEAVGAFQKIPMVMPATDMSAQRKSRNVPPTKGIANIAKRERNKGAKQLDALMKELCVPLRTYTENFPKRKHLHPYERSLIELTFGEGYYEQVLLVLCIDSLEYEYETVHGGRETIYKLDTGYRTSRCSQEKDYFCWKATCFRLC